MEDCRPWATSKSSLVKDDLPEICDSEECWATCLPVSLARRAVSPCRRQLRRALPPHDSPYRYSLPFKPRGGLHDASDSSSVLHAVRYWERRIYTAFTWDDEAIAARCLTDYSADLSPYPRNLYVSLASSSHAQTYDRMR